MNIIILAAGKESFSSRDGSYPLFLTEFQGKLIIEKLIKKCEGLNPENIIVALSKNEIIKYNLENMLHILSPKIQILSIEGVTQGAACTALLAIKYINNDQNLLILNIDEILEEDFASIICDFKQRELDAGITTFPSLHPRYSYVMISEETNMVVQVAEKNPISRNAMIGFYWFMYGKNFVYSAQNMIRKGASLNNLYYLSPTLNELVLRQFKIGAYKVSADKFHPIKTERQFINFTSTNRINNE